MTWRFANRQLLLILVMPDMWGLRMGWLRALSRGPFIPFIPACICVLNERKCPLVVLKGVGGGVRLQILLLFI